MSGKNVKLSISYFRGVLYYCSMKKILLIYAFLSVFAYAQLDNGEYFRRAIPEIGKTWQGYVILGSGAAVSGLAMMADETVRSRMTERQYLPPVLDHVADSYVDHYWAFGVSALGAVARGYHTDNYLKPLRYWAMSNVSTVALTYALKFSVRRTRPNGRNDLSYPSGHTSVAFATASMFQMWYGWKAGVPAYAMAVMTAFQRMDDDQHWLSDVVMGAAVGIAIPYMIYKGEENAEAGYAPLSVPISVSIPFNFPSGK